MPLGIQHPRRNQVRPHEQRQISINRNIYLKYSGILEKFQAWTDPGARAGGLDPVDTGPTSTPLYLDDFDRLIARIFILMT